VRALLDGGAGVLHGGEDRGVVEGLGRVCLEFLDLGLGERLLLDEVGHGLRALAVGVVLHPAGPAGDDDVLAHGAEDAGRVVAGGVLLLPAAGDDLRLERLVERDEAGLGDGHPGEQLVAVGAGEAREVGKRVERVVVALGILERLGLAHLLVGAQLLRGEVRGRVLLPNPRVRGADAVADFLAHLGGVGEVAGVGARVADDLQVLVERLEHLERVGGGPAELLRIVL